VAGEEIPLKLSVPDEFFAEFDRRFDAMARRATQTFNQAGRGLGGGGGSGASGNQPGGGSFNPLGGQSAFDFGTKALASAAGPALGQGVNAAAAFTKGFGQGIANTPAASASSPTVLAQNGLVNGVGSAIDATVGNIPIIGDFIKAQFNSVKEAMEVPTERAVGRLKGVYGNLAAQGYQASQEEMQQASEFALQIERKRYEGERNLERTTREVAARDSLTFGLSWIGR